MLRPIFKILPFFVVEWIAKNECEVWESDHYLMYRAFKNCNLAFHKRKQCTCCKLSHLHYECKHCGKVEKV